MSKEEIYEILWGMRLAPRHQLEEAAEKIAAKFSPTIANKATEEGELPLLPSTVQIGSNHLGMIFGYDDRQMQAYALQAIAADRASRQVANKAEAEPVAWMDPSAGCVMDAFLWQQDGSNPQYSVPVYATPPATTGASTGWQKLNDVQWMNIVNHDRAYENYSKDDAVHEAVKRTEAKLKELNAGSVGASTAGLESILDRLADAIGGYSGGPFDKVQAIIDELRAAPDCGACPGDGSMCKSRCKVEAESPASTVLTDERIVTIACAEMVNEFDKKDVIDFAREIEREVAAQAGQVAVPAVATQEMITAGKNAWACNYGMAIEEIYAAMIAAAPSPAKESK